MSATLQLDKETTERIELQARMYPIVEEVNKAYDDRLHNLDEMTRTFFEAYRILKDGEGTINMIDRARYTRAMQGIYWMIFPPCPQPEDVPTTNAAPASADEMTA